MNRRSNYRLLHTVVLIVAAFVLLEAVTASTTMQRDPASNRRLWPVAAATGRDAKRIELLEATPLLLSNGISFERYKALDKATNEIMSIALVGDRVVNEARARATAADQWRAQYGALTPALLTALSTLSPDSRLDVVVWLKATVRALPLRDHTPYPTRERSGVDRRSAATLTQAEGYQVRNAAALREQISQFQSRFAVQLRARAITPAYTSPIAPLIYLADLTRRQVEDLALLPDVDAIYPVPENAGPALNTARPAQNADLLGLAGYNGAGVKVSVTEGQRAYGLNPFLSVADFYDATQPAASHPTAVAGIIRSTHPEYTGLANGATLINANGSITDTGIMAAAIDWGAITATVLNNSWYWDTGAASFTALDRHMDYLVRYNANFIVGAAGNFGNGCTNPIGFTTSYVTSPAKGYNVLTIGSYDDHGTLTWADDTMFACSSFGDPGADITETVHAKPEVAAIGTSIFSTLVSSQTNTAIGLVGTGTSYATPMVAALAANLIQADPNLATRPEAIRSIIMATALHNIEGDARFSDKDGAGGIDATAAATTVERGDWTSLEISETTTFPITFTQFVYQGERARFVINWLGNPTSDYLSTTLPVDLDLTALRADGTTVVTVSASMDNNFEVVDFITPASEEYQFRVTRAGEWYGDSTRLGAAGWRGLDRLLPNTGYVYPPAPPLRQSFAVYPIDWTPTDHWRAFGVRSIASNHDLELYTRSWFDDPGLRVKLTESHAVTGSVDIIVVDGNHWPESNQEQYVVQSVNGNGGYAVNWSNSGHDLPGLGWSGPYTLTQDEVVKVFDTSFNAQQLRQIVLKPTANNRSDLGMLLFRSDSEFPASWVGARGGQVAKADNSDLPEANEVLRYTHVYSTADNLGLVIYSKTTAPAEFYLRISLDQIIDYEPIADTVYGAPPFVITATASSGLPVTFATSSTACAVMPNGLVLILGAGTCSPVAHQAGDELYNPIQVTQTFTIAKAQQTITFLPLPDHVYGDPPFVVTASASSMLPVTFESLSIHCAVNARNTVTLISAGLCEIRAEQNGNDNYLVASPVTQTLRIERAPQTIDFEPGSVQAYSVTPLPVTASASSGLVVTLTTSSAACGVLLPNYVVSIGLGECELTAHQGGDHNYLSAADVTRMTTIVRAAQTIEFPLISNKDLSDPPFVVTAMASSALPIEFTTASGVCTVTPNGQVTLLDFGQCQIVAHQPGNDFFYPAPDVEQSFLIGHLSYLPILFK